MMATSDGEASDFEHEKSSGFSRKLKSIGSFESIGKMTILTHFLMKLMLLTRARTKICSIRASCTYRFLVNQSHQSLLDHQLTRWQCYFGELNSAGEGLSFLVLGFTDMLDVLQEYVESIDVASGHDKERTDASTRTTSG